MWWKMNAKQTNKDKFYVTTVMLGWVCSAVAYVSSLLKCYYSIINYNSME